MLVAVVQMVPEWLKMRYRWYLQTFNILDYSLSAMAAWFVGRVLILEHAGIGNDALRLSLAGLAACVVFVAVNHILLAVMLSLARGFTLRGTPGSSIAEYRRHRPRARGARRRGVRLLGDESLARPVRAYSAVPDPPFTERARHCRRRHESTRRPGSSTRDTSRLRCRRRSAAPAASSARCR